MTDKDPIAEAIAAERSLLTSHVLSTDTDPTNNYKVSKPPKCLGCGGHAHGSVNEGLGCLTAALTTARTERDTLRVEVEELREEVARIRKLRAEVAKMPPHWSDEKRRGK